MATDEEVLEAINAALDAATSADRRDTAKRTLIILKAALPLLLHEQPPPSTEPEASWLVRLAPRSDAERAEIEEMNNRNMATLKRFLTAPQ